MTVWKFMIITALFAAAGHLGADDCRFRGASVSVIPPNGGELYLPWKASSLQVGTNGEVWMSTEDGSTKFRLPLSPGMWISRLFLTECLDDPLMVYEVEEFEGGYGLAVRLDHKTLRVNWQTNIPAFNVMEPLLHGHFLYVTGMGTVGKIDVRTGVYAWKITGLYAEVPNSDGTVWGCYNSFNRPEWKGRTIVFPENRIGVDKRQSIPFHKLVVDDRTGKVISGIVLSRRH